MTALEPLSNVELLWRFAQRVATTEFVPQAFRGRPDAVLAAIQYGRELGIGPMQSLQSIHVIQGKPSLSPEAMRARVFAAGHTIETKTYTDDVVTLLGRRVDGAEGTVTWTLEDAQRAKIAAKDSWKTYPRAMLLARATAELCRLLFPDVIAGASYGPEELGDEPDPPTVVEPPEVLDLVPVDTPALGGGDTAVLPSVSPPAAPDLLPPPGSGAAPFPSGTQLYNLQARVRAVQAAGKTVADVRKQRGLPVLKKDISVEDFAGWVALIEELEAS